LADDVTSLNSLASWTAEADGAASGSSLSEWSKAMESVLSCVEQMAHARDRRVDYRVIVWPARRQ
jgi:hypothetical protein